MSLLLALGVGLIQGWLHCAGMCGPFILAYAVSVAPPGERPALRQLAPAHLAHNLGRISAFAVLGAAFGGLGSFVDASATLTGLEAPAAVLGGLLMLLWAVEQVLTGHAGAQLERWSPWRTAVQGPLRRLLGRRDPAGAFGCGFLLGLHPCGLLFVMLLGATATGSALHGAALMAVFGLGTVPALLSVASAATWGARAVRGRAFTYASAGLIAAGGLLFTLRGLAANGLVPNVTPWLF